MTKLEAWKAWNETVGVGAEATEFALEKSSHGKAFSYAWDAAGKAEQERCCKIVFGMAGSDNVAQRTVDKIQARGET
jgi:hypothetical protein